MLQGCPPTGLERTTRGTREDGVGRHSLTSRGRPWKCLRGPSVFSPWLVSCGASCLGRGLHLFSLGPALACPRGQQNLSVKGQVVNISGCVGHRWSLHCISLSLCCFSGFSEFLLIYFSSLSRIPLYQTKSDLPVAARRRSLEG